MKLTRDKTLCKHTCHFNNRLPGTRKPRLASCHLIPELSILLRQRPKRFIYLPSHILFGCPTVPSLVPSIFASLFRQQTINNIQTVFTYLGIIFTNK